MSSAVIFPSTTASTAAAMREARSWLSSRRDEPVEERGHELRRPQAPVLPEGALRVTERSTAHADDEEETGDRGP